MAARRPFLRAVSHAQSRYGPARKVPYDAWRILNVPKSVMRSDRSCYERNNADHMLACTSIQGGNHVPSDQFLRCVATRDLDCSPRACRKRDLAIESDHAIGPRVQRAVHLSQGA